MNPSTMAISWGRLCLLIYHSVLKICTVFLLILALTANRAAAQGARPASGIGVGQALPDSLLNAELKLLGAGDGNAFKLAGFKGKPFILDFWASWCGSCIKSLPHADSLLKANGQALGILLVNSSARDRDAGKLARFVNSFLKDHPGFSVPFIAQHGLFSRYFKISRLPCYVWVGSDGRIKAISGYGTLHEENVRRFLTGGQLLMGKEGI
jgi:thiol-disulfide isomerase/thioredoxin